jgi:subfamily B ATP-binding cassette protein MsbA
LRYVRPHRGWVVLAVVMSAIGAAAAAAYSYLLGPLLKSVLVGEGASIGPLALEPTAAPWKLAGLVIGLAAVKAVSQLVHTGTMQSVGQRVLGALRRDLYGHLLALPPGYFEARHSGELHARLSLDVAQVEFAVTQALSSYVKDSLQIIALLIVCAVVDLRLFALAFIVLPAAAYPVSRFAKTLKRITVKTQASLGRLSELAADQLHNLSAIKAYRAEGRLAARFEAEQSSYLSAMKRSLFVRGAFTPTLEVLGIAGIAVAIAFGARAVKAEPALAERLLQFLFAALYTYQPVKALSGTFSMVAQGLGAAERLFQVLDEPIPNDGVRSAGPLSQSVELKDVRLIYPDGREALRGASLALEAGKKVALVGPSGAGKTTVLSLLLKLIEPRAGQATWNGERLSELSTRSLREQIAWVPQEPVLFSGTIRHNLLLAKPDASETELWSALKAAHLDSFTRGLPLQLDEQVGERGAKFSGGQRQRLALARAFLKKPSLLLLDEPTSALDAESERAVRDGLNELMRGRTTLVVAHRLSTVRDADLIFVLENGVVVEQGTHDELAARRGRYAALLKAGEFAAA